MWLYTQELIKVGYYPVHFYGHRHSERGDIVVLICQMISQNPVIKMSYDFMDRIQSREATILPCLVTVITVVEEISRF